MFDIKWEKRVLNDLGKLEGNVSSRIIKKVKELRGDFRSQDVKKIKRDNYFRLRVGDYRVLFSIGENKIIIWKIGHRKNIYKKN